MGRIELLAEHNVLNIAAPYLILIGDEQDPSYAKTGVGLVDWRRELVAGQLRLSRTAVDLGVPDLTIDQAADAGVKTLIIGVAPVGGDVPRSWWQIAVRAAEAGMDVASGLHTKLSENPELVSAADASGARLLDIRVPPVGIPVGNGVKRTGRRVLMVGTDCAIGKKYTALALDKAMREFGMKSTFRATGQTGIMIAGTGIPLDAVVADFISGAAEVLSPDNSPDHWDVVEGQGSLFHPGYAGVSLGLLHGTQPDAFVVCHDAVRKKVSGWPEYNLPSVRDCIDQHLVLGQRTNPEIRCVGISVNTSKLPEDSREGWLAALSDETGLPCVDPMIDGCDSIVDYIQEQFGFRE